MIGNRFIFLDIDGVLNCHATNTYWNPRSPETYAIDEECWENLMDILDTNKDVKVVMHTGWVKTRNDPDAKWDMGTGRPDIYVKSLLPEIVKRLGNRLEGYVPYVKGGSKYTRILAWLHENLMDETDDGPDKFVVIDDEDNERTNLRQLMKFPNFHVRFTDPCFGLLKEDVNFVNSVFAGNK